LRKLADRSVFCDAIFTANLALHFAFTELIRAGQHPTEYRVMLCRWSLRVSQAQQVAVRPTVTLLVLHRLEREVVGLAVDIPATHRVAQSAAPTAQSIHIFREVEQVSTDTADLGELLECKRL